VYFFFGIRNGNGGLVFEIFSLILGNISKPNADVFFTARDSVSCVVNVVNLLAIVLSITSLHQILFFDAM
jgi:hypothetical protein